MPTRTHSSDDDQMLPEYDFSGGERGKYYKRYQTMRLKFSVSGRVASKVGGQARVVRVLNAFAREDLQALKELMRSQPRPRRKKAPKGATKKAPGAGGRRRRK